MAFKAYFQIKEVHFIHVVWGHADASVLFAHVLRSNQKQ